MSLWKEKILSLPKNIRLNPEKLAASSNANAGNNSSSSSANNNTSGNADKDKNGKKSATLNRNSIHREFSFDKLGDYEKLPLSELVSVCLLCLFVCLFVCLHVCT